jgi:hypothetical protein
LSQFILLNRLPITRGRYTGVDSKTIVVTPLARSVDNVSVTRFDMIERNNQQGPWRSLHATICLFLVSRELCSQSSARLRHAQPGLFNGGINDDLVRDSLASTPAFIRCDNNTTFTILDTIAERFGGEPCKD